MPLFAILDIEPNVQLNDKTRLSAAKSFVTKGTTDLTIVEVTPSLGQSAIDVFDPNAGERYLDWVHDTWDADVTAPFDSITFSDSGGEVTATIAAASYSLSALATAVAAEMTSVGAQTYTASVDSENRVTISAPASFTIVGGPLASELELPRDEAATSQVGERVESLPREIEVNVENGTDTAVRLYRQRVYSVEGDRLFSDDGLLQQHEPDILKWVPPGRATFLDVHRRAQELILAWLDEQGYVDIYRNKYTKWSIADLDEVRQWSGAMVLRLIFEGISNAVDDVFREKSKEYAKLELMHKNRAVLRLDTNADGTVDLTEGLGISSGALFRR